MMCGATLAKAPDAPGPDREFMATILLIDDSPDFRALARLLLEQGGHRIIEAEDGRGGYRQACAGRPDLILSDLAMPDQSGWDVLGRLKADPFLAAIPVVALSAHAMKGDRERALAAGFDGFLSKPIDDEAFEASLRRFLRPEVAPIRKVERPAPAPARVAASPPPPGRRRVLVVDDNPSILELIRLYLGGAGFEVATAHDGASALETVEAEAPALVVLDVMLPGMDGYEVTARIKADTAQPFLPVVLVTAGTPDRERGLAAGADDFLGKPIERVELIARVSSLLRLREAIQEGRRQAEELKRIDKSKERFIATVAHDLRTPLNAMALTVEMLRVVPQGPGERDDALDVLGQNIRRMADLLTGLLDYSRLVAGELPMDLAPFDPRALVRDVRDSLAATAASRGLELRSEVDDGLPGEVLSDYAKCRQIVFNLGSNALKFTRRGRVTFRARPDGRDAWAIDVADTGVGMAEEDLGSIFEEFVQARIGRPAEEPGTGLGLAISRRLCERLGGTLAVTSELGRGSTFSARWPLRSGGPDHD